MLSLRFYFKWIFGSHFVLKAIIFSAQSSLSSNYCLRVTADGANQNARKPVFNIEFIPIYNNYSDMFTHFLE